MSKKSASNLLKKIFELRPSANFHTRSFAEAINKLVKSAFIRKHLFIYELLQNADDSPCNTANLHIDVNIYFLNDYILFQHNGAPFKAGDVVSLSGIGHSSDEQFEGIPLTDLPKSHNPNKIGYKGIGFKSVFAISDCCYIFSGDYCFKFDSNFAEWRDISYPWQLIPIECLPDDLPSEIASLIDHNQTNVLLHLNTDILHNVQLKKTLFEKSKNIATVATNLLFLRHTKSVTVKNHTTEPVLNFSTIKTERQDIRNSIRKLIKETIEKKVEKYFLVESFEISVDQHMRDYLNKFRDDDCPPKLKLTEKTSITFAAELEIVDGDKLRLKEFNYEKHGLHLFTYLPTNTKLHFPFIINADFLLNQGRTEILPENKWNEFLYEKLAWCLCKWFASISKSDLPFKLEFLKIFRRNFESLDSRYPYREPYNKALKAAIATTPFVPPQDEDKDLMLVEDSIVDYISFNKEFETTQLAVQDLKKLNRLKKAGKADFAHNDIWNIKKLVEIGATEFNYSDIITLLRQHERIVADIPTNIKLLDFLFKHKENRNFADYLRQTRILKDENGVLRQPDEIFFPSEQELLPYNLTVELHILNADIYQHICQNPSLKKWIFDLGVQYPTKSGMVKKVIDEYLSDPENISVEQSFALGRYFFSERNALDDVDKKRLYNLPVVCTNNRQLNAASNCYLSDFYKPELPLEIHLGSDNLQFHFVTEDYVTKNQRPEDWQKFWVKIGVSHQMRIEIITTKTDSSTRIERTSLIDQYPAMEDYFRFLDKNQSYNPAVIQYANTQGQHQIKNIYTITLMEYTINNPIFAKLFWQLLFSQKIINFTRDKTYYYHRLNQTSKTGEDVPTYIQYFARTKACLPDTLGNCQTAPNLYSSPLAPLVLDVFPVVDLVDLLPEQVDYLGIKNRLSIQECLLILNYCSTQPVDLWLIERIEKVYEYISDNICNHLSEDERRTVKSWKGMLLAADHTFNQPQSLYLFNVTNAPLPNTRSSFLKESRISTSKMINIANLFGLNVIVKDDMVLNAENIYPSQELKSLLKSRITFLAKYVQHHTGEKWKDVKDKLLQILQDNDFYTATHLDLAYKHQPSLYHVDITCRIENQQQFYHIDNWRQPEHLMPITRELCRLLDISMLGGEMQLFLTLDDGSIARWLRGMGIDVRNEIGIIGEQKAMAYLKEQYNKDYPNAKILETQTEFELRNAADEPILILKWNNQEEESFMPYDFIITKFQNGQTEIHYIEIKTTSDEANDIIYLSALEWDFMVKNQKNYSIYRLYLNHENDYSLQDIVHISNPMQKITLGQLLPLDTIALKLLED